MDEEQQSGDKQEQKSGEEVTAAPGSAGTRNHGGDGTNDDEPTHNPEPLSTNDVQASKAEINDDAPTKNEREKEGQRDSLDENENENHEVLMEGEEDNVIY